MAAVFVLLYASDRTHRPPKPAGVAAQHPCAWCPAESQASLKVSKLQATAKSFCAQGPHSAHASRREHSEIVYMDHTVFNLTEEGGSYFALTHKSSASDGWDLLSVRSMESEREHRARFFT